MSIKVAIVEENRTVRETLETIINLAPGCKCVGAWSAAEDALQALQKQAPEVVLLDLQLGSLTGAECTARVRERLPEAQIILLTVYEDPERIFRALRAGASGYLLKRSTPEQIIAGIWKAHTTASSSPHPPPARGSQNSPNGELANTTTPVTLPGEP